MSWWTHPNIWVELTFAAVPMYGVLYRARAPFVAWRVSPVMILVVLVAAEISSALVRRFLHGVFGASDAGAIAWLASALCFVGLGCLGGKILAAPERLKGHERGSLLEDARALLGR